MMKVIDISCTYKDSEETHQLFDSVSAAAVWFAHEVRDNLKDGGVKGEGEILDEVARQVALLVVHYDDQTGKDPDEVNGGDEHCRYGFEPKEITDLETAKKEGRNDGK